MLDEVLDELFAKHAVLVSELEGKMLALRALRSGGGKQSEIARRRLKNHRSKLTYPEEAAESIRRNLHDKREALAKTMRSALPLAIEIELLEQEEEHLMEILADIDVGRTELKEARFWPGAAKFARKLNDRFGIDHTFYALLTDGDLAQIGKMILKRRDEQIAAAVAAAAAAAAAAEQEAKDGASPAPEQGAPSGTT